MTVEACAPILRVVRSEGIVLVASTLAGCGTGGVDASRGGEEMARPPEVVDASCVEGDMNLTGRLDNDAYGYSAPYTGQQWREGSRGNTFASTFGAGAVLELAWVDQLGAGETGPVTGTLELPDTGLHASATFCAGEGSRIQREGTVIRFWLVDLTMTEFGACPGDTPFAGEIRGCLQMTPQDLQP